MPSAFLSRIFGKKSEHIHPSLTDSNIPTRTLKSITTIVLPRSNSWADTEKGPEQTPFRRSHSLTDDDTRRQTWRASLFKGKGQKKGRWLDGFLPTWKRKQPPVLANEAVEAPQIYLSYHAAVDRTGPYGAPVWLEDLDTADALPKDRTDIFATSGHLARRRTVHFDREQVATKRGRTVYDHLPPAYRYTSFSDSALNRHSPVGSVDARKGLLYHSDFHISHLNIPREVASTPTVIEQPAIEPDTVSLSDTLISNQACVGRDCDPVYLFQRRSWALVSNLHGVGEKIRELYADVMGASMDYGKIVEKWCS
ncbi:hypothetical protein SpCBS45565_g04135 [Spizellomyces sp. 'palustris']|nr:hypothetical protein SpCBS45565_g04135 [Spizellomyces sp. 'palustris']